MAAVIVRISGAQLRLTHHAGSDFVWVYLITDGSARVVGYFDQMNTNAPRRRWFGRVAAWRSNLDLPLRTLYDDAWQFWASRCPEDARRVTGHGR